MTFRVITSPEPDYDYGQPLSLREAARLLDVAPQWLFHYTAHGHHIDDPNGWRIAPNHSELWELNYGAASMIDRELTKLHDEITHLTRAVKRYKGMLRNAGKWPQKRKRKVKQ